ncbi:MAG: diguanylate cyclase, partial [Lachnospiraceae bacterium]|nr:diguanylate cyclase [Lachnospiraceae bacterium]
EGFQTKVNGVDSYCVFKKIGSTWVGRVVSNDVLYENIVTSVVSLALCCILMGAILVMTVTKYMNRYVVECIHDINVKLRSIAAGNLDENVDAKNSIEFVELSTHINEMVKNLLENNKKMSYVLSKTDLYIGVYEYNSQMNKVRVTEYVPRILGLDDEEAEKLVSNYVLFKEFISRIRENPLLNEESIFRIEGEGERYVRIEESNENREIFGVVIDVTEDIKKRKRIEAERDIDVLTGLYNRRGLENRLAGLFAGTKDLGYGALVMIDADGLKGINDKYGHENGDIYLQKIANIIKGFGIKDSVAARLGGDEFVLFLYSYNSNAELLRSIESLHYIQDNSTVYLAEGTTVPLRFSFGYTVIDKRVDYLEMLKEADEKMYESKRLRKAQAIKV